MDFTTPLLVGWVIIMGTALVLLVLVHEIILVVLVIVLLKKILVGCCLFANSVTRFLLKLFVVLGMLHTCFKIIAFEIAFLSC